jgi:hypothetical protein
MARSWLWALPRLAALFLHHPPNSLRATGLFSHLPEKEGSASRKFFGGVGFLCSTALLFFASATKAEDSAFPCLVSRSLKKWSSLDKVLFLKRIIFSKKARSVGNDRRGGAIGVPQRQP